MKYEETGFQGVDHQFCVFEMKPWLRKAVNNFPGSEDATHILTYGYIDHDAGVSLEVLACVQEKDPKIKLCDGNDAISVKIRIGQVMDDEFYVLDEDDDLNDRFQTKIDALKQYEATDAIKKARTFPFVRPYQNIEYPDDIQILLYRQNLEPEAVWVRMEDVTDDHIEAKLLNDPYDPNFGVHAGDWLKVYVKQLQDQPMYCYSDVSEKSLS